METLKVVWKDLNTRQRFVIAELIKEETGYVFQYDLRYLSEAQKHGFKGLVAFPNLNEIYKSENMFSTFESRLPDKKRSDIKNVLKRYDLEEFDAFELLKRTEGRQPIDTLEFIYPIDLINVRNDREFFVAGVRHYEICGGLSHERCTKKIELNETDKLLLRPDENNAYDQYAVVVEHEVDGQKYKVGYIPMYYACEVKTALEQNEEFEVRCEVLNFDATKNCQECLKAKLSIIRKQPISRITM